jgi:lysine 2,3-aminomutase
VREYLEQLDGIGESTDEYAGIYGYSIGQTEKRMPLFEYPPFDFSPTEELTNLDIGDARAGVTVRGAGSPGPAGGE